MSRKASATASGAWTVEENKLVSAVETFGTTSWATNAANVPGQCSSKWRNKSRKAAATATGVWTVEEDKKLVSAVATIGTSWSNIAANVPGRNEKQCSSKWDRISIKASATDSEAKSTASGAWTAEEEKKLVSAVATVGTSWANIAANVRGRNEKQCSSKWNRISIKAAATSSDNTTVEDFGDNMPSAETSTDGYTSGDEPPGKRRRFDWV
jgi:cytochrome c551/c552